MNYEDRPKRLERKLAQRTVRRSGRWSTPVCGRGAYNYAERRSGSKAARIARPRNAEQSPSVFCCSRRRFAADVFEGHDAIALAGSTRHAIAERGIELRNGEQNPSVRNDLLRIT